MPAAQLSVSAANFIGHLVQKFQLEHALSPSLANFWAPKSWLFSSLLTKSSSARCNKDWPLCIHFFLTDKNSKEQFIKKLQLTMKTYDYKDEQKDVKGKVSSSSDSLHRSSIHVFIPHRKILSIDWALKRDHRAPSDASGLENRCERHHSQPRRSHADDWEKHFQATAKR